MAQQREGPIPVMHNELELFEHMLNNKMVNRHLEEVIKDFQIIRLIWPADVGKTPGLRLVQGGWRAGEYGINLDNEGMIGEKVMKVILVEGYAFMNQSIKYDGETYEGSENTLQKIADILNRIVEANQKYETPDLPGINFDIITPVSEIWFASYNNNPDMQGFQIGYSAQFERVYSDIEV